MGIGAAIVFFAAETILYWAVEVDLPFVDDDALGAILIFAGALALAAAVIVNTTRRSHGGTSGGTGIALLVTGAVLYWTVDVDLPFIFDGALGAVLMVAGVIAVAATLTMQLQASRSRHTIERQPYKLMSGVP